MPDALCTKNFIYDGHTHPAFVGVWFNQHQEESQKAAIKANLLAYGGARDALSPNSIVEGLVEILGEQLLHHL